jgi:hypothetical protein
MRCIVHSRICIRSLALIWFAVSVSAHHGASGFDPSKEITLRGRITQFAFTNPHVQIELDVSGSPKETAAWKGELPAPNVLMRAGWNRRTLHPGDRVIVTGFQAWRGERAVWVRKIVGPNGQPLPLSP